MVLCLFQELVWILHKALEASQLEKRTCAEFLAAEGEQKRLELLRHRERQVADLQGRLEESKMEAEVTRRSLAQRDVQLAELQDNVRILMDKNNAKQEVRSHLRRKPRWTRCGLIHSCRPSVLYSLMIFISEIRWHVITLMWSINYHEWKNECVEKQQMMMSDVRLTWTLFPVRWSLSCLIRWPSVCPTRRAPPRPLLAVWTLRLSNSFSRRTRTWRCVICKPVSVDSTVICNLWVCSLLQDDIEAYKTQNTFLNSEIYQLTKLWRKSSEQEKSLMVKVGPNRNLHPSVIQLFSSCFPVIQTSQEVTALCPSLWLAAVCLPGGQ